MSDPSTGFVVFEEFIGDSTPILFGERLYYGQQRFGNGVWAISGMYDPDTDTTPVAVSEDSPFDGYRLAAPVPGRVEQLECLNGVWFARCAYYYGDATSGSLWRSNDLSSWTRVLGDYPIIQNGYQQSSGLWWALEYDAAGGDFPPIPFTDDGTLLPAYYRSRVTDDVEGEWIEGAKFWDTGNTYGPGWRVGSDGNIVSTYFDYYLENYPPPYYGTYYVNNRHYLREWSSVAADATYTETLIYQERTAYAWGSYYSYPVKVFDILDSPATPGPEFHTAENGWFFMDRDYMRYEGGWWLYTHYRQDESYYIIDFEVLVSPSIAGPWTRPSWADDIDPARSRNLIPKDYHGNKWVVCFDAPDESVVALVGATPAALSRVSWEVDAPVGGYSAVFHWGNGAWIGLCVQYDTPPGDYTDYWLAPPGAIEKSEFGGWD